MSELGREPETLGLKCRFNMNPGCLTSENHSHTLLTAGMPGFIVFYVPVTYTTIQVAHSASRSVHYLEKNPHFHLLLININISIRGLKY